MHETYGKGERERERESKATIAVLVNIDLVVTYNAEQNRMGSVC